MTTAFVKSVKGILAVIILIACFSSTASAQTIKAASYTNSKVTVIAADSKTSIAISNFPKKTRVVVFDSEDNLISIVSTDNTGAANVTLPTTVKNTIYVKTLNGEVLASNKTEVENNNTEGLASQQPDTSNKA